MPTTIHEKSSGATSETADTETPSPRYQAPATVKVLSFDDIFRAIPHEYRNVPAPELGGVLRVRGFTGAERDVWESSRMREKQTKNGNGEEPATGYTQDFSSYRVMAVALAAVHADGSPIFSALDAQGVPSISPANMALVGGLPASVISRAFNAIIDLSALTVASQEALEKN